MTKGYVDKNKKLINTKSPSIEISQLHDNKKQDENEGLKTVKNTQLKLQLFNSVIPE